MMTATEVELGVSSDSILLGTPSEQDQFVNMISHCQSERMEEQRCSFQPSRSNPSTPAHKSTVPTGPGSEEFFSLLSNIQTRRLDDQRVSLASLPGICHQVPAVPCPPPPPPPPQIILTESTPISTRKVLCSSTNPDKIQTEPESHIEAASQDVQDDFITLISHSQRGRMDEQRCSFEPVRSAPTTPKHNMKRGSVAPTGPDAETFFSLISDTQSRRLDDQRAVLVSLPETKNVESKSATAGDASYMCYMVSKVQGSRMEEQRCSLPVISPRSLPLAAQSRDSSDAARGPPRSASFSPGSDSLRLDENRSSGSNAPTGPDADDLFRLLANTQSGRLDDQRASLGASPRIQNGSSSTAGGGDSNYLCYMVSKVQGSRMEEQRCSAPHILQDFGTPSVQLKAQAKDGTPGLTVPGLGLVAKPRRSASFSPGSEVEKPHQELSASEQNQMFAIMQRSQCGRMDEQRCSLELINGVKDEKFRVLSNSQSRRLDDQRVALPSLPGLCRTSDRPQIERSLPENQPTAPQITLTEGTPDTARKSYSGLDSQSQTARSEPGSPSGPSRSASFSPGSQYEIQNSAGQVTVRVSMSFTPQQGREDINPSYTFPELFLTLGVPGDSIVVPLTPSPTRTLSLNLNLVPKEDSPSRSLSPCASPSRVHRRASSSNPGTNRKHCSKSSSSSHCDAQRKHENNISPEDNCFSLIERVHSSHLQKGMGGGERGGGDPAEGKGKAETVKGKGKRDGGRDKGGRKR